MACIFSSSMQMKLCPLYWCNYFADINLLLSHQIGFLIYLTLGDTHAQLNNFFLKLLSFDFKDVSMGNWKEMSCSSFAIETLILQSRLSIICHTILMLVVILWQPTICKIEKGLVILQQSKFNCHCSRMLSQPIVSMLSFIVMDSSDHAATYMLSPKSYDWLYLYFSLCGLWDYLLYML